MVAEKEDMKKAKERIDALRSAKDEFEEVQLNPDLIARMMLKNDYDQTIKLVDVVCDDHEKDDYAKWIIFGLIIIWSESNCDYPWKKEDNQSIENLVKLSIALALKGEALIKIDKSEAALLNKWKKSPFVEICRKKTGRSKTELSVGDYKAFVYSIENSQVKAEEKFGLTNNKVKDISKKILRPYKGTPEGHSGIKKGKKLTFSQLSREMQKRILADCMAIIEDHELREKKINN